MNPHASPEEQRIATDASETPSLLDEKKFLEERRRRLEASLHDHVIELRDRSQQAGKFALVGAGALLGVWLVAKALGSASEARQRKKKRALAAARWKGLGAGSTSAERPTPADRPVARPAAQRGEFDHGQRQPRHAAPPMSSSFSPPAPRPQVAPPPREAPPRPVPPPAPAGPTMFQTFMESEAGRMMTNQMVALLMVFVTRKLENLLQIERGADIGAVKESDLTPYRIVDPVSDATVVPDDADSARPNAAPAAPPTAA